MFEFINTCASTFEGGNSNMGGEHAGTTSNNLPEAYNYELLWIQEVIPQSSRLLTTSPPPTEQTTASNSRSSASYSDPATMDQTKFNDQYPRGPSASNVFQYLQPDNQSLSPHPANEFDDTDPFELNTTFPATTNCLDDPQAYLQAPAADLVSESEFSAEFSGMSLVALDTALPADSNFPNVLDTYPQTQTLSPSPQNSADHVTAPDLGADISASSLETTLPAAPVFNAPNSDCPMTLDVDSGPIIEYSPHGLPFVRSIHNSLADWNLFP